MCQSCQGPTVICNKCVKITKGPCQVKFTLILSCFKHNYLIQIISFTLDITIFIHLQKKKMQLNQNDTRTK
jgi:hypothetical protein